MGNLILNNPRFNFFLFFHLNINIDSMHFFYLFFFSNTNPLTTGGMRGHRKGIIKMALNRLDQSQKIILLINYIQYLHKLNNK